MPQIKLNWEAVAKAIEEEGLVLHGERVGIWRDEAEEEYGDSGIIKPVTHMSEPLSGAIVALGIDVSDDDFMYVGRGVNFNKFNVIRFELELDTIDEPVVVDVLHVKDVYWGWDR